MPGSSVKKAISSSGAVWPVSRKTQMPIATAVMRLPISEKVCVSSSA